MFLLCACPECKLCCIYHLEICKIKSIFPYHMHLDLLSFGNFVDRLCYALHIFVYCMSHCCVMCICTDLVEILYLQTYGVTLFFYNWTTANYFCYFPQKRLRMRTKLPSVIWLGMLFNCVCNAWIIYYTLNSVLLYVLNNYICWHIFFN